MKRKHDVDNPLLMFQESQGSHQLQHQNPNSNPENSETSYNDGNEDDLGDLSGMLWDFPAENPDKLQSLAPYNNTNSMENNSMSQLSGSFQYFRENSIKFQVNMNLPLSLNQPGSSFIYFFTDCRRLPRRRLPQIAAP